jgi:hypothetical protein
VHAYVGDEVIVSWPVSADPARNARRVLCFSVIERKMARLAADHRREFQVAPAFHAGLHAGPVFVSECRDAKRQLAFFGDTMNVAARLCEHSKAVDRQLVVSRDLLHLIAIPADFAIGEGQKHCGARSAGASYSACDRTCVDPFTLSPRPTRSVSVKTIRSRPISTLRESLSIGDRPAQRLNSGLRQHTVRTEPNIPVPVRSTRC